MVAADVVEQQFVRDGKNVLLQLLQVVDAYHLLTGVWIAEDKVSETEVVRYRLAQIDVHLFGVLIDEAYSQAESLHFVFAFGRL